MALEYLTHEEAERLAGKRLDRRRKWFIWGDDVCCNESATIGCSGCGGDGCFECGFTGKRVEVFPVPAEYMGRLKSDTNQQDNAEG